VPRAPLPAVCNLQFDKTQDMRYGENPHQSAAFYREPRGARAAASRATQLQGKELSYNNIADADAAWECVKTFDAPACVIVKHANPCGVAVGGQRRRGLRKAFKTDPTSAFGGIIAFNRRWTAPPPSDRRKQFVEVLIAPSVTPPRASVFAAKQNVRVLEVPLGAAANALDFKRVGGGCWCRRRHANVARRTQGGHQAGADRAADGDLLFAWKVAKFVKSNAIVFCAGA
jgi:phosphoribosylaminoimidazolecarboxamide formyltransferase/IMP cyclohydrolase